MIIVFTSQNNGIVNKVYYAELCNIILKDKIISVRPFLFVIIIIFGLNDVASTK